MSDVVEPVVDFFGNVGGGLADVVSGTGNVLGDIGGGVLDALPEVINYALPAAAIIAAPYTGGTSLAALGAGGLGGQSAGPLGAIFNLASSLVPSLLQPRQSQLDTGDIESLYQRYSNQPQTQTINTNSQIGKTSELVYPDQAYITSARNTGRATLGTERTHGYDQLARNLSARGFGSNSAYAGQGAGQIEGSYLQGLSNLESNLAKTAVTPVGSESYGWSPSTSTTTTTTGGGSAFPFSAMLAAGQQTQTNPLALALGMMSGRSGGQFGNVLSNWLKKPDQGYDYSSLSPSSTYDWNF